METPNKLRFVLWVFMTFMVMLMLGYTITHGGPQWKVIALSAAFVFGLVFCILLYQSRKKDS